MPKDKNTENQVEEAVHTSFALCRSAVSIILSVLISIVLIGAIAGCVVVGAFAIYLANNVDSNVDDIVLITEQGSGNATKILYYDQDGNLVEDESQRLSSEGNSYWVSYDDIPENLVNAFVAIEDKRFWDHNGFDLITTVKAVAKFFLPLGESGGGSTITQQLIKNVTHNDEYTIQRKVNEIFKSIELEKKVGDKTKIIESYLNVIYLSQGAYGVQEAAHTYFNKDVSDLSLLECAAIAGITQNPSKWDPVTNPENNKSRRNVILTAMYSQGLITKAEYDEAYDAVLTLDISKSEVTTTGTNSWYTDAVIDEASELLAEKYGTSTQIASKMLYSGGYSIITAQDKEVQAILDKYYQDMSDNSVLPVSDVINVESAMIVMDPHNGNILGLVGGRGEKKQNRIFNLATDAVRQPGSSLKPIAVYAPALQAGIINYGSVFDDVPYNFGTVTTDENGKETYSKPTGWPRNSNNAYRGLTTIEYAIAMSKNTIAVHVLDALGINNSYDFLTNKVHLTTLVDSDKNYAALGLGGLSYGVTLKELTAAYSIFSNNGVYTSSRTVIEILDNNGDTIIENETQKEIVLSEENAQVMTKLLGQVIHHSGATASTSLKPISKLVDVAGKTGTTNNNYDKWFVGYTPYYLAGIWTGYVEQQNIGSKVSNQHCVLWNKIMVELHQEVLKNVADGKETLKTFDDELLIEATYCIDSGKLITEACEADPRGNRSEVGYFTKDTLPTEECDCHVLVKYCVGHGVANDSCPESSCTYVGLLNVKRVFPVNIYVTDGQYTYVDLNGALPYTSGSNYPFYWNLYIATDKYSGRTYSTEGQYNRYCTFHKGTETIPDDTVPVETDDNDTDLDNP